MPLRSNDSPIWAITPFYNPAGYKRRRANFDHFRDHLGIPLVVVELSYNGEFQISKDDADVVVHLSGSANLWQKERLLNVALEQVPQSVKYIAWLDADIIFQNPCWYTDAVDILTRSPITQLFSHLYDLGKDVAITDSDHHPSSPSGFGIAYLVKSGTLTSDDFLPKNTGHMRRGAFGLAWAAQRSLLEIHGFYDAMILGSGDRAMACAGYGRFDATIQALHLNEPRTAHYMAWANRYYDSVQGNVDYLPGAIYHLWHGDLANRGYKERHIALSDLEFDPALDLRVDDNGVWAWTRERPEIQTLISGYFESRREDGEIQAG